MLKLPRPLRLPLAVLLTIALAVVIGRFLVGPEPAPIRNQFDAIVPGSGVTPPRPLLLHLTDGSGQPAVGAFVVLFEPELSAAWCNTEGLVTLPVRTTGPIRLQAYLPGHELLLARGDSAEEIGTLQFTERVLKELPELQPIPLINQNLRVQTPSGRPLARLVIRAGPQDNPEHLPWLAFTDAAGEARLEGIEVVPLHLEAFAPGLPLLEPWRLAEWQLSPQDGTLVDWRFEVADLTLEGLPVGEALHGQRLNPDAPLPLRRVPPDGRLRYPALPPGRYSFRIAEQNWELDLATGEYTHTLSGTAPPRR